MPLNANFEVTDATRIISAKPTIIKVLEDGGSCILMSHLGRPKGVQEEFSLKHDPFCYRCFSAAPFDDEGVPKRVNNHFDCGKLQNYVVDLASSRGLGVSPQ